MQVIPLDARRKPWGRRVKLRAERGRQDAVVAAQQSAASKIFRVPLTKTEHKFVRRVLGRIRERGRQDRGKPYSWGHALEMACVLYNAHWIPPTIKPAASADEKPKMRHICRIHADDQVELIKAARKGTGLTGARAQLVEICRVAATWAYIEEGQ